MYNINIEIGTKNEFRNSNGNVLPLVAVPFAMQSFVLQTNGSSEWSGNWFYNPEASYAEGFRMTNQPSPWLGDYGHIIMLASSDDKYNFWDMYSSTTNKVLSPWYMSTDFCRYDTKMEVVPHEYGGKVRLTYTKDKKNLIIRNYRNNMEINVANDFVELINHDLHDADYGKGYRKLYKMYFDSEIVNHTIINENDFSGVILEFNEDVVEYDVITSYISFEQCDVTKKKITSDFETLKNESKAKWEDIFNLFDIDKSDDLFYSNVYRAFLFPHIAHEVNANDEIVHYSFYTNKVEKGYMYTDIGFWDVYRSSMPLVHRFLPERYTEIVKSLLNVYQESGWLPRWMAPFERGIMPSTLVDPVVAHAIINDVYDEEEKQLAMEALLKNATIECENEIHGRKILDVYLDKGYVPLEEAHECVSRSLDNCYSDYCIAVAMEYMGMDSTEMRKRSKYYLNLLDPKDMFLKPKLNNGEFVEGFDPSEWGTYFCESDAYTNNFSVTHDIEHFLSLWDKELLEERLDKIFNSKMNYTVGKYGTEIHEITEAFKLNFGHVAISNQPGFNLPFIFYYLEEKEKLSLYLEKVLSKFTNSYDGYPGDEDNGSMSAYYIWIRLGEFPYDVMKETIKFKGEL